jgi:hypothetical protein
MRERESKRRRRGRGRAEKPHIPRPPRPSPPHPQARIARVNCRAFLSFNLSLAGLGGLLLGEGTVVDDLGGGLVLGGDGDEGPGGDGGLLGGDPGGLDAVLDEPLLDNLGLLLGVGAEVSEGVDVDPEGELEEDVTDGREDLKGVGGDLAVDKVNAVVILDDDGIVLNVEDVVLELVEAAQGKKRKEK